MIEHKNKMRSQIYKRDGKFYVVPHLDMDILNNSHYECGYVYELDLDSGEISVSEYFEEPTGKFDNKYEKVGWCEIGRVDCWHIAPKSIDISHDTKIPSGYFASKDFQRDEE